MTTTNKGRTLAAALQARATRRRQLAAIVAVALATTFLLATVATQRAEAQTLNTLHSFNNTDGFYPYAGLVQAADGNLYGTTFNGGTNGQGTVFKITPGGSLTTLYSFLCSANPCPDGAYPSAGLVQATDGNLYGTTSGGINGNYGTVFKISAAGELTTVYGFCPQNGCFDGAYPSAGLVQGTDGNFYGTTPGGGAGGNGTIFQITPSGTLTTLHSFCSQSPCTDGTDPQAGLVQATDGNLYGTTYYGGTNGNWGTVFKIAPGGAFTTLYSFCSQGCADGFRPSAGLVQGTDGNLYGTTTQGGFLTGADQNGYGTVFKITSNGELTTLHSFCSQSGCPDGANPYAGLVQATDGNFYGTTNAGGANGVGGTVFKITPSGELTTLYSFCSKVDGSNCTDGSLPRAGLVQASDGNLYGTTSNGGANGEYGTVFSLSLGLASVTLSPTSLPFGNQPVTITSGANSITLTNGGGAPLSISGITPSGDFAQSNDCPFSPNTLAAGAHCTISVTFTPTATGPRSGAITIVDNASNSPQSVPLSGNGTDFSVSATPAAQTVRLGKSAKYTLSVTPISGFTGTAALSCSGAPPVGTCTVSPNSVTLNGINAASATATATTSPGKKGTPKGLYTLTLSGSFGTLSHSTTVTLTVH